MKLGAVILNVRQPKELAEFYRKHLGMQVVPGDGNYLVGYGGLGAQVELRPALSEKIYVHRDTDPYWKIGITLPDVDAAYGQLRRAGVAVSEPKQFRDIGYMCHLSDPEGFRIELLQHTFRDTQSDSTGDDSLPLGGGAQLGQITLRVSEIEAALASYRDELGMRLLSIQKVSDLGFTLYFLAFTEETPPLPDLESVANREWLWQRPYTTLELQHLHDRVLNDNAGDDCAGFQGLYIEGAAGTLTVS